MEIINKGKTPIVVGGTGLYVDSLIYEIEYQEIEFDEEYRKETGVVRDESGFGRCKSINQYSGF